MPDEDITFTDLIRGEITFKAGSVPDYVIVRANGHPLYTLVNPIDDALMEITHVLRGEDLLSSTPRQIVLYRALEAIGVAKFMPRFGHLPYVMGEGNKKLSKRDPESNLLLHKAAGMIPEGLNNYLALLGWSIAPDRDIFSMEEMAHAFDISDVNPNPARFDQKKAVAINAEHIRLLDGEDFRNRLVPFLHRDEVVSADSFEALTDREREILTEAAPLVQTRIQVLGEASGMLGFLLVDEDTLEILRECASSDQRIVFHCYSGDAAMAERLAERGWYASFAGPITYPANSDLRAALAVLPRELVLVETDAPYLTPVPWRRCPNAPYVMAHTVRFIAQLWDVSEAAACDQLRANTEAVCGSWLEKQICLWMILSSLCLSRKG